jgi:hypothetical protein
MKPGVGWNEKKVLRPILKSKTPLQMKNDESSLHLHFHISISSSACGMVMEEQTEKTKMTSRF